MNCKNCDAPITGDFCSACGQKAHIDRISVRHLFHELIHILTDADKGFLLLMKELPRRPGLVAKGYIQGQRKKYFNPLMFLVITGGASVFLTHEFGSPLTPLHPLQKETLQLFFGNERLFMLLMVPLLSFFSWISFFRSKYNFAENCILQS